MHAVAPGAELYLAAVGEGDGSAPTDQIVQAALWLAAQDLDIISFSGGGHDGPHNGTAQLDRLVDRIVADTGVLWVNAAGNEGGKHWSGLASDRNGDLVVELDGEWRGVAVRPSGDVIALSVNWDDWGRTQACRRRRRTSMPSCTRSSAAAGCAWFRRASARRLGRGRPVERVVQRVERRAGCTC